MMKRALIGLAAAGLVVCLAAVAAKTEGLENVSGHFTAVSEVTIDLTTGEGVVQYETFRSKTSAEEGVGEFEQSRTGSLNIDQLKVELAKKPNAELTMLENLRAAVFAGMRARPRFAGQEEVTGQQGVEPGVE